MLATSAQDPHTKRARTHTGVCGNCAHAVCKFRESGDASSFSTESSTTVRRKAPILPVAHRVRVYVHTYFEKEMDARAPFYGALRLGKVLRKRVRIARE